jgi:trehalose 6-phosphate phosphatase
MTEQLDAFVGAAESAGILLDVDGTLSPIAERPELARLVTGTDAVLSRLVERYRVVAAISGRTQDQLERLVDVEGVRLIGSYGLRPGSVPADLIAVVLAAADQVEGAWMETKGATIAVHYRATPDATSAGRELEQRMGEIADQAEMALLSGKHVVELVPAGFPLKEGAVERIIESDALHAALYAGDDIADLLAFEALDRAHADGRLEHVVKVAVHGAETPEDLVAAADIVVEGVSEMVDLLATL